MGLVQQPEPSLAIARAGIGWIKKHAAAHQDAERLRNQRADPAHVEVRLARAIGAGEAFVDVGADRAVPVPAIGGVDGELRRAACDLHGLPDQQKLPRAPVENEDVDPRVERENERRLRTVDGEACGTLRRAGLKEGREEVAAPGADRKDGADGDVVLQIGRSVERVDRDAEMRFGTQGFRQRGLLGKHRRHRGGAQCAPHHFVGDDIDVFLPIAVGIDAAILSGNAHQRSIRDQRGKLNGGGGDGFDHFAHRGAVRRLRSRPIEMRTQRHALVHGRLPVPSFGGSQSTSPGRRSASQQSAVCRIREILLSLAKAKFLL